ncbi:MAG TPA: tetratricopeptide repeat protein, partial [Flavobacteriales bacterium]|nr:tetratricopeptide repeat protein [Flavobacteriales bacterium]
MSKSAKALHVKTTLTRAKSHIKKGELEAAQKLYIQILETYPLNQPAKKALKAIQGNVLKTNQSALTQAQIDSVIELFSNGHYQQALDTGNLLITEYPNEALLYNISGACFRGLGQLEAAVKHFEQALEIKPYSAEPHNNLGITLKELGQLEAAVKHHEQALALNPDYAGAHYNLGITLKELGQLDAAVKCYEQALALKPDYAEAHAQ